jgi:trehalose utilization protein
MLRVTVWNEYQQEKNDPEVAKMYPNGIDEVIAQHLRASNLRMKVSHPTE